MHRRRESRVGEPGFLRSIPRWRKTYPRENLPTLKRNQARRTPRAQAASDRAARALALEGGRRRMSKSRKRGSFASPDSSPPEKVLRSEIRAISVDLKEETAGDSGGIVEDFRRSRSTGRAGFRRSDFFNGLLALRQIRRTSRKRRLPSVLVPRRRLLPIPDGGERSASRSLSIKYGGRAVRQGSLPRFGPDAAALLGASVASPKLNPYPVTRSAAASPRVPTSSRFRPAIKPAIRSTRRGLPRGSRCTARACP